MTLPTQLRFPLWLAGTLIVGALGNGLWELAKPGLVWVGNALLDVATLGLASLRDGIYVEIAKGTYERAAEKTLSLMIGMYTGLPVAVILIPKVRRNALASKGDPTSLKRKRWFALAILISIILTLMVQNYRLIYVVRAANHLEQLLRVVAPFQTETERLVFQSRFASMETRAQYVELTLDITEIAKKNKARIPDFDVY